MVKELIVENGVLSSILDFQCMEVTSCKQEMLSANWNTSPCSGQVIIYGTRALAKTPSCLSFWWVTSIFDWYKMTILDHFIQFLAHFGPFMTCNFKILAKALFGTMQIMHCVTPSTICFYLSFHTWQRKSKSDIKVKTDRGTLVHLMDDQLLS